MRAMTQTDDLGRKLTLSRPARRIVSLSPATTENLFAIGAGKFVVGVTSACDFPAEAQKLPTRGGLYATLLREDSLAQARCDRL